MLCLLSCGNWSQFWRFEGYYARLGYFLLPSAATRLCTCEYFAYCKVNTTGSIPMCSSQAPLKQFIGSGLTANLVVRLKGPMR